eukprot:12428675-Karenia_brevis.AAC.1
MAAPPNRETGEPDLVGTITAEIPVEWTAAPKYQWRHGTDAYAAPHICQFRLAPSAKGAGMEDGDTP